MADENVKEIIVKNNIKIKKSLLDQSAMMAQVAICIIALSSLAINWWTLSQQQKQLGLQNKTMESQNEQLEYFKHYVEGQDKTSKAQNKARLQIINPVGEESYGYFEIVNYGNYEAKDIKIGWRLITTSNDMQIDKTFPPEIKKGVYVKDVLQGDDCIEMFYQSNLDSSYQGSCFLIVYYEYSGDGIMDKIERSYVYFFDRNRHVWYPPNPFDKDQIQLVVNEQRDSFIKAITEDGGK